jgi:hypothetical protein
LVQKDILKENNKPGGKRDSAVNLQAETMLASIRTKIHTTIRATQDVEEKRLDYQRGISALSSAEAQNR